MLVIKKNYYKMFSRFIKINNNLIFPLCIIIISTTFLAAISFANNLTVENVSVEEPDSSSETTVVQFDISWDNSWKNAVNNDAVWVFVKYSDDSGLTWNHATLSSYGSNPSGFDTGTGTNIDILVPADKKGCFIERAFLGAGEASVENVGLVWDWGADGLTADDSVRVKVFGIEMVFIPEGAFYIGDGDGSTESSYAFHYGTGNSPVYVTASLASNIRVDAGGNDDGQLTTAGIGLDGDGGIDIDNNGVVDNIDFPTGYSSFYIMKYEITEDQWVDFFNTLTTTEKARRDLTGAAGKNSDSTVNRNTVAWTGTGSASTQRPDRACGYLSWMDLCAYADWAALRPVSELEYEKAARGGNSPVLNEFAWGNTAVSEATSISGAEDGSETVPGEGENCCYNNNNFSGGDSGTGPLRAGIFATDSSSRAAAGSGYYGVMELTGNLNERCVTVGDAAGRAFLGSHGDGALSAASGFEGNATNEDWPGYASGQGVTGSGGSGIKGGSWAAASLNNMHVSGRAEASLSDDTRSSSNGGRCGRTGF